MGLSDSGRRLEDGGRLIMHEFRMFALDTTKKGYPERMLRPWCVCGWLGEWTDPETRPGLKVLRAAAQKQFMGHLESLRPRTQLDWVTPTHAHLPD